MFRVLEERYWHCPRCGAQVVTPLGHSRALCGCPSLRADGMAVMTARRMMTDMTEFTPPGVYLTITETT